VVETTLDRGAPAFAAPAWVEYLIRTAKEHERGILLGAAGFHALVLLAMIALHFRVVLLGEVILLRVVPVDPRDLFRGDYVVLSYDFSRVPPSGIAGLAPGSADQWQQLEGRPVYVSLVPEGGGRHWRTGTMSLQRPAGGKYLQGRFGSWGRLEFGIEAYYVQEGKGRAYEQAVRDRRLSAEVALTGDGQAKLRGLRVE
jgi:uncharacterized membrane-anchored protein